MKKIDLNKLNQLIEDYPFLYIPYLIKISINKSEFNNNLNSLALRHPNRIFLKNFIDENDLKSDFIDDFIRKNPKIIKKKNNNRKSEDLASKRLSQKEFITENMAKIYIKQNKIKKAIKIYEKLISLNSKKKTYFAKKIKNLKN
ncbi:MAG: hypothetical protein VX968_01675 [Bacteroidota bacterium]|nr:hypothetical protein [Bacteroidota bacterium]